MPCLAAASLAMAGAAPSAGRPETRAVPEGMWAGAAVLGLLSVCGWTWGLYMRRRLSLQAAELKFELEREAALKARHEDLFENASELIFTTNAQGSITSFNRAGERITGFPREEVLRMSLEDWAGAENWASMKKFLAGAATAETVLPQSWLIRGRDGRPISLETNLRIHRQPGRPAEIQGIARDTTERERMEAALRESEANLKTLFGSIRDFLFVADLDGRILAVNSTVTGRLGYLENELAGAHLDILHPREFQEAARAIPGSIQPGQAAASALPLRTKAGQSIPVETQVTLGSWSGRPAIFGISRDITERQQAAEELKASQERFAKAFNSNPNPLVIHRQRDGLVLEVNDAFLRLAGQSRAQTVGKPIGDLPPAANPEDREAVDALLASQGSVRDYEFKFTGSAARLRSGLLSVEIIELAGERCQLSAVNDITERIEAEAALRHSQERLELALGAAGIGLWEWDAITDRIQFDPGYAAMHGQALEELDPNFAGWKKLVHPEDLNHVLAQLQYQQLEAKGTFEIEYRMRHASGEWRWMLDRCRVLQRDGGGRPLRTAGIHLDISERKQVDQNKLAIQDKMRELQHWESMGLLAGGIAHDFNNLLTAILGNASLARLDPLSPALDTPLAQIEKAAQRAAELCRQMLSYAGMGQFALARINLTSLAEEGAPLLHSTISKKANLKLELDPGLPHVDADISQVRQVLLNLVTNAAEALGNQAGDITITTGVMEADAGYLRNTSLAPDLPAGKYAYLRVQDTGCGMAPEVLSRIFDPFYTTKFMGRGLGLPVVLGIVRGHQGALKVESAPGKGSTFTVLLPAAMDATQWLQAPEQPPLPSTEPCTVLLVDDEDAVRSVARCVLERANFTILEAANGREGLEQFHRHEREIQIILLDLSMPEMNGEEFLQELRRVNRTVPVVLSSGYLEEAATARFAGLGLAGFVPKPYRAYDLPDQLRKALAGDAQSKIIK